MFGQKYEESELCQGEEVAEKHPTDEGILKSTAVTLVVVPTSDPPPACHASHAIPPSFAPFDGSKDFG
ncbi:unnamed protein product [Schistocephalus solidus]|uniref:Uncharacterized protein n=1 Tax=Schistocephalus solidus TaxID=70667 RepID=A0A183TF98_SCHSO|nr:unnamed protein product [Schistocephalus solidus]